MIQTFETPGDLYRAAAELFVETARFSIGERGRFRNILSGGNTPMPLFHLLAKEYIERVDWGLVHFFWADERCVPTEDPENNYHQAKTELLVKVNIPTSNVHPIPSELEPENAAAVYARELKDFSDPPLDWPRFDLVLLGLGEDGHTASLFPGSPVDVSPPTLAVTAQFQGRPANRVTLTQHVFNTARIVIFLVSGKGKSKAVARTLGDEHHPGELPAQRIHPVNGKLHWFLDREAASLIQTSRKRI